MQTTTSAAGYTTPYTTISFRVKFSTWMSFSMMSKNSLMISKFKVNNLQPERDSNPRPPQNATLYQLSFTAPVNQYLFNVYKFRF